ncbi:MAG: putative DNA base hypermodification protein [Ignavibacteria bacterium]|jgi:hypothetical protein
MIKIREEIYPYYFYFIQERMNIFWRKLNGSVDELTNDAILKKYKFTNVYRACDRVSQYLIKNVIYDKESNNYNEIDILLRIVIFKIFNKIETWEYIENRIGKVSERNFDISLINKVLCERKHTDPIFSNAYMMTGSHSRYNHLQFKHEKWLSMVKQELLDGGVFKEIIKAKSLEEVYKLLRDCSFLGDFLAYQYTIDINYSPVINFSENSFVKAGIGAQRGIKKCFKLDTNESYEDLIVYTYDNFDKYQQKFGYKNFRNLFGRNPTLIDIQNCFCETDKYLRAKVPELQIDNTRIKQKYKKTDKNLDLYFPPKWGLNLEVRN